MSAWVCHLVACAVLVMGVEGVLDVAHAHSATEDALHTPAAPEDVPGDGQSNPEPGTGPGHCGHYCHGHVATLPLLIPIPASHTPGALAPFTTELRLDFGPAPPTPPPNA